MEDTSPSTSRPSHLVAAATRGTKWIVITATHRVTDHPFMLIAHKVSMTFTSQGWNLFQQSSESTTMKWCSSSTQSLLFYHHQRRIFCLFTRLGSSSSSSSRGSIRGFACKKEAIAAQVVVSLLFFKSSGESVEAHVTFRTLRDFREVFRFRIILLGQGSAWGRPEDHSMERPSSPARDSCLLERSVAD